MSLLTVDVGGANETVIQFVRAGHAETRKIGARRFAFAGNERSMIRAERIVLPVQLIAIPAATAVTIRSLFARGAVVACAGDVFNNGGATVSCMGEITDEMEVGGVYWNLSLTLREVTAAPTSVAADAVGSSVLVNWYDAQGTNYTALGLSNGATLTTWPDESGNGNDAPAQDTLHAGANSAAAMNGFPGVYFSPQGNNQRGYLTPNAFTAGANLEAFIVLRTDLPANGGGGAFWDFGEFTTGPNATNATGGTFRDNFGSEAARSFTLTVDPTSPFLYHVRSRAGQWRAWVNGTLIYATAINTVHYSVGRRIGAWLNSGVFYDNPYTGWIGEVLFYEGFLSPAAAVTMESDMMTKWGITP